MTTINYGACTSLCNWVLQFLLRLALCELYRLKTAPQSRELLEHFERNMGCIEIQGKSGRIERVYFEVKDTRLRQWEEAQIQVSRRNFLHSVEMGSQKNKLKGFMTFCDETIFEVKVAAWCLACDLYNVM